MRGYSGRTHRRQRQRPNARHARQHSKRVQETEFTFRVRVLHGNAKRKLRFLKPLAMLESAVLKMLLEEVLQLSRVGFADVAPQFPSRRIEQDQRRISVDGEVRR